jgi:hypothetical protein
MVDSEKYQVGDLAVDVTARLLICDGELVTFLPKTFELFVAMALKADLPLP